MQPAELRQAIIDHLHYSVGLLAAFASPHDYYRALALAAEALSTMSPVLLARMSPVRAR
jgi:hypothetical protein